MIVVLLCLASLLMVAVALQQASAQGSGPASSGKVRIVQLNVPGCS
jgi:preprotein translocase subunit SecG